MSEEYDWEVTIKPAEEKGKIAIFLTANFPPRSVRADVIVPYEDLAPILDRVSQSIKEMAAQIKGKPAEVETE